MAKNEILHKTKGFDIISSRLSVGAAPSVVLNVPVDGCKVLSVSFDQFYDPSTSVSLYIDNGSGEMLIGGNVGGGTNMINKTCFPLDNRGNRYINLEFGSTLKARYDSGVTPTIDLILNIENY